MLEEEILQDNLEEAPDDLESIATLKLRELIDSKTEAAIICRTKKNNPNYLSIVGVNKKFCEVFDIEESRVIGKNYDFLFEDIDLDYSSEDQLEYVRLIKAVKDFHECSLIISIADPHEEMTKVKFKVTFTPHDFDYDKDHHYSIFIFEKMDLTMLQSPKLETKASDVLLRNLERSLRNERLLRRVGNLIISDLPIQDIAKHIAKILCEHLKTERCVIHDYHEGQTNFVVEYHDNSSKAMLAHENLEDLVKYINFQNHFYEKFGDKTKKSSYSVVDHTIEDSNFFSIVDICNDFGIISQIAVTTTFNGKVNGGIYIHQSTKRNWLEDEIDLVQTISDQFSIALDRSVSIERVMVTNHALIEKTSQLRESLKHEQEMRKMQNEFVALVSHEFKTPLQIIDSTRELIARKLKSYNIPDVDLAKYFERIKSGIQRMNGLINSTLNLAKMENGENKIHLEIQSFNLRAFIIDIIEKNLNLAANKEIKIITKLNELPQQYNGDTKLLDHSITNIISNAIKYSPNHSTVRILAKVSDKKIGIRIIDEGIGIPKEDLTNIGQKFFRAKNTLSVAGTGIGLYLTKHFIELHGGDVLIESQLNVGTSVTVILPRLVQVPA